MACKIRLNTTEVMQSMKLPCPELPLHNDHSVKIPLLTGKRSASLVWHRLDAYERGQLENFILDIMSRST